MILMVVSMCASADGEICSSSITRAVVYMQNKI